MMIGSCHSLECLRELGYEFDSLFALGKYLDKKGLDAGLSAPSDLCSINLYMSAIEAYRKESMGQADDLD